MRTLPENPGDELNTAADGKRDRSTIRLLVWLAVCVLVIIADQLTKLLARTYLLPVGDFPIIKGVLHLTYVENTGAAFGMLKDHRFVFLIISSVAVVAFLVYLIIARRKIGMLGGVSIAFIVGGGIGNMIDRVALGCVTDFINFELIDFAVFNLADSMVCIGSALLVIYVLFLDRKDASHNAG